MMAPEAAPLRNPLYYAVKQSPLFVHPIGTIPQLWGTPWKVEPDDWVAGPIGMLLLKEFTLPPAAPGRIEGFALTLRKGDKSQRWMVPIDPVEVLAHSAMRLGRMILVPEFLPDPLPQVKES